MRITIDQNFWEDLSCYAMYQGTYKIAQEYESTGHKIWNMKKMKNVADATYDIMHKKYGQEVLTEMMRIHNELSAIVPFPRFTADCFKDFDGLVLCTEDESDHSEWIKKFHEIINRLRQTTDRETWFDSVMQRALAAHEEKDTDKYFRPIPEAVVM